MTTVFDKFGSFYWFTVKYILFFCTNLRIFLYFKKLRQNMEYESLVIRKFLFYVVQILNYIYLIMEEGGMIYGE